MRPYARIGIKRGEFNPLIPRLESNTVVTNGGCWLFQRKVNRRNAKHCKIGYCGKMEFVHRASWMHYKGPIPAGKEVLHLCIGNGNCWNPDHLYIGTDQDNVNDRQRQGRAASHKGLLNGRCKLSESQVREIRGPSGGFTQDQIGEMYGISRAQVSVIRRNKEWSHL